MQPEQVTTSKEQILTTFHARFENPAESCPWDDGEYVFLCGGPYSTEEALDALGIGMPDELRAELERELSDECFEWSERFLETEEDRADREAEEADHAEKIRAEGNAFLILRQEPDGSHWLSALSEDSCSLFNLPVDDGVAQRLVDIFGMTGRREAALLDALRWVESNR